MEFHDIKNVLKIIDLKNYQNLDIIKKLIHNKFYYDDTKRCYLFKRTCNFLFLYKSYKPLDIHIEIDSSRDNIKKIKIVPYKCYKIKNKYDNLKILYHTTYITTFTIHWDDYQSPYFTIFTGGYPSYFMINEIMLNMKYSPLFENQYTEIDNYDEINIGDRYFSKPYLKYFDKKSISFCV